MQPARLLRTAHRFYKRYISPLFGNACRFEPDCSTYALESILRHGLIRGVWLAANRLIRCNPFHAGGYDPVPPQKMVTPENTRRDDENS